MPETSEDEESEERVVLLSRPSALSRSRKVAASLDLFRRSSVDDEERTSLTDPEAIHHHHHHHVHQTQFVKRADWPARGSQLEVKHLPLPSPRKALVESIVDAHINSPLYPPWSSLNLQQDSDLDSDINTLEDDDASSDVSVSAFSSASSSHFDHALTPPPDSILPPHHPSLNHIHSDPRLRTNHDDHVQSPVLHDGEDDFDVFTWPENTISKSIRLPHVTLRPFRNQVGGHSAIYKFTRRAVCKPLVSRENLFYEAVEREAPPLLGFIPRYLGVMLVNYRRVRRSSNLTHNHRPPIRKAATNQGLQSITPPNRSSGFHTPPFDEHELSESEQPQVLLDRNRHIVPPWMLRGRRESSARSRIHKLQRAELRSATASSPELRLEYPIPPSNSSAGTRPLPRKALPVTLTGNQNTFNTSFEHSDDDSVQCSASFPPRRHFHTMSLCGGRGSTLVNTRLKDHVFGAIFKRLHRHNLERWARTEDDGELADIESFQDHVHSSPHSPTRQERLPNVIRRAEEDVQPLSSLRRVQSEIHINPPTLGANSQPTPVHTPPPAHMYDSEPALTCDTTKSSASQPRRRPSRSFDPSNNSSPTELLGNKIAVAKQIDDEKRDPSPAGSRQEHFILMEDLTGRLRDPCVLDIKMGTRQYGIDATVAKKKSQRKKCDRTTSRSLGLRLCGMQVWDNVKKLYITQNKYVGREIRKEEFKSVLGSFLYDGERLLVQHIPFLLLKIYGLARIIYRLKGYRFYGCSLLFIYEGDSEIQDAYLRSISDSTLSRSKRSESLDRQVGRHADHRAEIGPMPLRRIRSEDLLVGPMVKRVHGAKRKRGEMMIRIVDFAHTTTGHDYLLDPNPSIPIISGKGYQADVDPETGRIYARFPPHHPSQPDLGFLFGLKNLAATLETIWNEERARRLQASRFYQGTVLEPLGALPTYGKEIFEVIFGSRHHAGEIDPGMIST